MRNAILRNFLCCILPAAAAFLPQTAQAQIDHWETVVNASTTWRYFRGTAEPPADWRTLGFADGAWTTGAGGVGFGDGDDGTTVASCTSVYLRKTFNVVDTSQIYMAVLHMDFDDGFIAYLNDVEIGRFNLGAATGDHPAFSAFALSSREAEMYTGGAADNYYLDKAQLNAILRNGSNVLAIQVHNNSASSPDLTSNAWFSFGMKNPGTTYGPVPSWFYGISPSSNLPLVHINTNGATVVDDPRVPGTLGITDNGPGVRNYLSDPYNNYFGDIDIEIRGSTSQQYPKKGYGLELKDSLGNPLDASLLGMPKSDDWILYGPYPDKTLMRNELTYQVFEKMGHYSPRYRYCELYINHQYLGVYSIIERVKIENTRLDMPQLEPDDLSGDSLTGGYIIKVDKTTGSGAIAWYSPLDADVWFIGHDPETADLLTAQKNYIQTYVTSFENALSGGSFADPVNGYRKWIDVNSFMDFMLMQELGRTVDGYRSSTFLHKTVDSYGGKLRMGPMWDFNLSYGNADYCDSYLTAGWQYNFNTVCPGYTPHIPFWWDRFLDDPRWQNELRCRWDYLRDGPLSTDSLHAWVDSVALHLNESMNRNFDRWPIMGVYVNWNYFVGANYNEEVNYLKTWLTNRAAWMDANLPTGTGICNSTGAADIRLTEINYNSDTLSESGDWIELHNAGSSTVDLSGWRIKDDNATHIYEIPSGTTLQPDSFLVICQSTAMFDTVYSIPNRIGNFNWALDNEGDGIRLYDAVYTPVFEMRFDDIAPWPDSADGDGYTLEIVDINGDLNDPANWQIGCPLGSPGAAYTPPCTPPVWVAGAGLKQGMTVYPNPLSQRATVRIPEALLAARGSSLHLTLTSLTGQEVMHLSPTGTTTVVDASALPSGIYFLALRDGEVLVDLKKVMVNR